jgi:hypothetical protein
MECPQFAFALDYAEHNVFVGAALRSWRFLIGVFVLFFATYKRCIAFNGAFQRRIERFGARGVPNAMENVPSGLLRYLQVFCHRGAGDSLRMVADHPHCHEPFAERQFGVVKDGSDFDRKPLAAITAFESLAIRKVIDTVSAERHPPPFARPWH